MALRVAIPGGQPCSGRVLLAELVEFQAPLGAVGLRDVRRLSQIPKSLVTWAHPGCLSGPQELKVSCLIGLNYGQVRRPTVALCHQLPPEPGEQPHRQFRPAPTPAESPRL